MTPNDKLDAACKTGVVDLVESLVETGNIKPNVRHLHTAACGDHKEVVKYLCKYVRVDELNYFGFVRSISQYPKASRNIIKKYYYYEKILDFLHFVAYTLFLLLMVLIFLIAS